MPAAAKPVRMNSPSNTSAVILMVVVVTAAGVMVVAMRVALDIDVQLTIDHFIPLEIGGKNDNLQLFEFGCCCCNKDKGATDPNDWCTLKKLDYEFFVNYLKARKIS